MTLLRTLSRPGRLGGLALGVLALLGGGLSSGCVSQGEYDNTAGASRALQAELQQALAERDAAQEEIDRLSRASEAEKAAMRAQLAAAQERLDRYGALEARINEVDQNLAGVGLSAVDPATDAALRALASSNPGMVSYDSRTGTVRFAADVTFDSGSAVVKDQARNSLRQFAQILSGSGAGYDIEIVGHTDSQQPRNPQTLQRHPTNRHLSVHRAIAVGEVITGFGIPSNRVKVAGWGEYRPAVQNTSTGNTPANRRVEILLRPSTAGSAIGVSAPSGSGSAPPPQPRTARDDFPIK
ncbi:MAG: OmpA/MotB family protein [Phycisphaerales bacterium]